LSSTRIRHNRSVLHESILQHDLDEPHLILISGRSINMRAQQPIIATAMEIAHARYCLLQHKLVIRAISRGVVDTSLRKLK
jgi:hypothetical protein